MTTPLPPDDRENLRQRAREMLETRRDEIERMDAADLQELLEELNVHQIELELQNEDLRRAWDEVSASREAFRELYDFAPVGYLTLGANGLIENMNVTCADMFGQDRAGLMRRPLSMLVHESDKEKFQSLGSNFFRGKSQWNLELRLKDGKGTFFHARLEGRSNQNAETPNGSSLVAVVDITRQKRQETELEQLNRDLDRLVTARTAELQDEIAERERAETELREMQQRLDMASWGADVAWWDWYLPTGEVVSSSRKMEMLGYSAEECDAENGVIRMPVEDWKNMIHPDDYDQAIEEMTAHLQGRKPYYQIRYRLHTKDDLWRWVFDRGRIVERDEEGKPLRVTGMAQDISEFKKSEQERDLLFNLSQDMLCVAGTDGYFRQLNPSWQRRLGWSNHELTSRPLYEIVHPDDLRKTRDILNVLVEGVPVANFENRLLCRNGEYRWVLWNAVPYPDENLIFAITRDITNRKQVEFELNRLNQDLEKRVRERTRSLEAEIVMRRDTEEQLKRFRSALDQSADNVFIMDQETLHFLDVNATACRTLGYSREELLTMSPVNITPGYDDQGTREIVAKILGNPGNEYSFEARHQRKDGSTLPVEISVRAISSTGRKILVAIARDISSRRDAEKLLQEAKDRAEAASRAKSEFLANMSHEIRTPLNGVIGLNHLLLETQLDEKQRQYAQTAMASGESLLALINDILDFSKIEAGKLELEKIAFSLHDLLDESLDILAHKALEAGLELSSLVWADVPPRLRGDPGKLRQILLNLVGNALKFTEKGEVAIEVGVERQVHFASQLRFKVRDTGIGIPADRLDRLFQSFSQADSSTTRRFGGTGLGLAICKQLVEAMGGEIGVWSKEGEGSVFWFTVLLEREDDELEDDTELRECLEGKRALVVDDNATNRLVLKVHLEQWGAQVLEAEDGEAAWALCTGDSPPDLALLDLYMPGLDGEELSLRMAGDPQLADMPRFLISSIGRPLAADRLRQAGFLDQLSKPLKHGELLHVLRECARKLKGQAPAPNEPQADIDRAQTLRILVAEDNPINQMVAVGVLEDMGHTVECVDDGQQALDALESKRFDVVLMDCQMPELDGYEATRRLRERESRDGAPRLPVLAMTAGVGEGERERCLAAGMDDYVAKPIEPAQLDEVIRRHAQR